MLHISEPVMDRLNTNESEIFIDVFLAFKGTDYSKLIVLYGQKL